MRMANNFTSISEAAESAPKRNAIPLSAAAADVDVVPTALWLGDVIAGHDLTALLCVRARSSASAGLGNDPKELLVSRNRRPPCCNEVHLEKQDATGR